MSVSIASNRSILSSFRTVMNTWAAAINTLITDMSTAQGDITTLQGEMNTAQADILLKQTANAISTLNDGYRALGIAGNLLNTDYNKIIHFTSGGALTFTFAAASGLANFANDGGKFLVYNDATNGGNITLTPSGCTLVGNVTVTPGQTVWIIRTAATQWTRLTFA
jgi:hypothetical protein